MAKDGVKVTIDKLDSLKRAIKELASKRVMVGVPAQEADRQEGAINNAALAYIHDKGAPEAGIPARPFMDPGITGAKGEVNKYLKLAGSYALDGNPSAVEKSMMAAGQAAVNSIKSVIRAGIPPPLKPATVARRGRTPGSAYRRKARTAAQTTPLIDTAQLINSISYVLRKVKK